MPPDAAATALRSALDRAPETPLRPLLRLYLFCVSGELVDLEPPSEWIPITSDTFAPEPQ